jgi:hypothetical protein
MLFFIRCRLIIWLAYFFSRQFSRYAYDHCLAEEPLRKILLENYSHCDTMPAMRAAATAFFQAHELI